MPKKDDVYSCVKCKRPDTNDMVQCDDCDNWYHFACAAVDGSVANQAWSCEKCEANLTILGGQPQLSKGFEALSAGGAVGHDLAAVTDTKLNPEQRSPSVLSSGGRGRPKIKLELARLEEQRLLDQQYLAKKYELLALGESSEDEEEEAKTGAKLLAIKPRQAEVGGVRVLTAGQLSARQALSKELPAFSGKPEEWAIFISNYRTSTELCGFTDAENLVRLQRVLKGKAMEVVGHNLLLPEMVPEAISTLEMLFGRPEFIINSLLRKIRAEPPPRADKFESLVGYAVSVRQLLSTMKAAGLRDHLRNPMLLQELVDKLPPSLRLNWALAANGKPTQKLEEYSNWLNNMAQAASTLTLLPPVEGKSEKRVGHLHAHQETQKQSSKSGSNQACCFLCQGYHRFMDCEQFKSFPVPKRREIVKEYGICENCLRHSSKKKCSLKANCSIEGCSQRHHSLLHSGWRDTSTVQVCNAHQRQEDDVLFRIAPVTLHANGKAVETFAFLDSGSSLTLMEQEVANALELKGEDRPLCLKWTADVVRVEKGSQLVSVEVSPRQESSTTPKRYFIQDIRTVQKLSLPRQSFDACTAQRKYQHLKGLPLKSYTNVQPKLLIGIPNEYLGVALKVREGEQNQPIAMETRLGWVVCGGNRSNMDLQHTYHHHQACDCERILHEEVRNFFALENHGTCKEFVESAEEKRALEILKKTTKRIDNRFESGLLWRYDDIRIPDSYPLAFKRLLCIERKMHTDPALNDVLNTQIEKLLKKGYARKLDQEELQMTTPRSWYLPTFIVRNPNKPGKVRLVWDGAAKIQGVSLNSLLLKGPDQLAALPAVLYSFRSRRVAISGDICEMFHQIRVRKEDQQFQRFLWRNGESNRRPDVYVMEVLTFGASCSPSVAQYVKNTNATDFIQEYPRAVVAITKNHYVDDLMDSVDTEEEAIQLAKDVLYVHSRGGFRIRGFLSNSTIVMKALGELSSDEKQIVAVSNTESTTSKVLGIWWKTEPDIFTFSLRFVKVHEEILRGRRVPTKREMLKVLMSIFDPLGFLAHYLVILKVLLQEVWRSAVDWDEAIPERLHHQWEDWLRVLPLVENVKIPRCYSSLTAADDVSIQLHVFVDASENVMAAVAYFRICTGDSVDCALVGAKTKVAPRIPMSIPRMELQAATMGVKLAESIVKGHSLKIHRKFFWSDSRTVLSWLTVDPRKYNQFVMYRIGEVLEGSKLSEWRWIPTKENVADDATKWKKMPTFHGAERWFRGPSFLLDPEDKWPSDLPKLEDEQKEELRPRYIFLHMEAVEPIIEYRRFSTYKRLLRSTAWVTRFVETLKRSLQHDSSYTHPTLTAEELNKSQTAIVRMVQHEVYSDDIAVLVNGGRLSKSNTLTKCSPYIDDDGLLRMKGRIDQADCVEYCTKRPILMPRHHQVTSLLINHYHNMYHHCCHETVVNEMRQKFWIPMLRTELKAIRRRCTRCQQNGARPTYPQMAPLPATRLAAYARPFTFVGVDYFGPMIVTVGRRSEKRWGVLFTCLTVRAVHLELAHSLSTDSCIMCVRNFIGRRGTPREFYSDNGTNFKGTERELQEVLKSLDSTAIRDKFTTPETKWIFNPPSAPHMGGSWERMVGSVKKILKEVTRNQRLQDDSLQSMLIEAEAIVNSRPLTYVSLEADDVEALTPNHFLLGSSDGSKPPGEFGESDLFLRKSWRKCQQLTNMFWKRWVREYLPTLTRRTKWFESTKPIEEGDMVIIVDDNLPRGSWPKGIVVATYKAQDGQVRRAAVKTATGVLVRPAVKLAVLNIKEPPK